MHKNGERYYEAELYRLKGELLLAQEIKSQKPVLSVVEGSKGKSQKSKIQILNSQSLNPALRPKRVFRKPSKLLGSNSQSPENCAQQQASPRLWQQQGKRAEAHKLLSDIYNWFTEGFAKDLQEAKALLDSLASNA